MPSGKTHDAVTFLLVAPTLAAAYLLTEQNLTLAAIVAATFLFGGLMFGPDLDTRSRQYTRWSVFRFLWRPYQAFFKHRSRWSHGLIFGTFIRIVYFVGALSLLSFFLTFVFAAYSGAANEVSLTEFVKTWRATVEAIRLNVGDETFTATFVGLWLGAASHTITDLAGTYIKTGRISEFL